jgi:hypothetical protein
MGETICGVPVGGSSPPEDTSPSSAGELLILDRGPPPGLVCNIVTLGALRGTYFRGGLRPPGQCSTGYPCG